MRKIIAIVSLCVCMLAALSMKAEAATETKTFSVSGNQTLLLENLIAKVTVKKGVSDKIVVLMTGEKSIKEITVKQEGKTVSVKGKAGTKQSGSIISIGGTSNAVIVSNGDINIESDGDVAVNGQKIKGVKRETTIINITVPVGTGIEMSSVNQASVSGLGGKLNAHVSGGSKLDASDVSGIKLKCSGQSECKISNASGDARMTASGQSNIRVTGRLGDVEVEASGQSEISINGNCRNLDADASGQSEITVHGKVAGKIHKHESGQSEISIR